MQNEYAQTVDRCAESAATLSRSAYNAAGHNRQLDYDLARLAAQDRGIARCVNIDVVSTPDNVGAALCKMFDDMRAANGQPRKTSNHYMPRIYIDWGDCEPCEIGNLFPS